MPSQRQETSQNQEIKDAVACGDVVKFKRALGNGYDFKECCHVRGWTVLHESLRGAICSSRSLPMIQHLLDNGADPSQRVAPSVQAYEDRFLVNRQERFMRYSGKSSIRIVQDLRDIFAARRKFTSNFDDSGNVERADYLLELFKTAAGTTVPADCIPIRDSCIDMWDLIRNDQDSHDVTLADKDDQQTVRAHSHILATSSRVLKAMLMSPFSEGGTKKISVDDALEPGTLNLFLEYLYCGSAYHNPAHSHKVLLDTMNLSHRWQIDHVTHLCCSRLIAMLSPDNAEAIAEVAIQLSVTDLEEAIIKFARKNKTIQKTYRDGNLGPALKRLLLPAENVEPPKKKRRHTTII